MGLLVIITETTWKTSFESKNFHSFGCFAIFPSCSYSTILAIEVRYKWTDVCAAELNTQNLPFVLSSCCQNQKCGNYMLLFCRGRYDLNCSKCVPHVEHTNFSSNLPIKFLICNVGVVNPRLTILSEHPKERLSKVSCGQIFPECLQRLIKFYFSWRFCVEREAGRISTFVKFNQFYNTCTRRACEF